MDDEVAVDGSGDGERSAGGEGVLPTGQYWRGWAPVAPRGAVVLVHGVHEHVGRYDHVAARLTAGGYAVYAADHPGHGRSPGRRGNIGTMAGAVDGVSELVRLAARAHPELPVFVYGHSLGGLIALQYLTGEPADVVRGAVLSAPALDASAATRAQRLVAPLLSRLAPNAGVLALDPTTVSRDPAVVAAYRADPMNRMGRLRARTGAEVMIAAAAMPLRLASLTLPLLIIHGGADRLVPVAASRSVAEGAASTDITLTVYEGLYHEPHNEPEQEEVLGDIVSWLDAHAGDSAARG